VLEVLGDFRSARPPVGWLLSVVPRLRPRYFSISSSPRVHPRTAHLTVAVVSWTTPHKRARVGLCTSWLAALDPAAAAGGVTLPCWVARGSLQPPPDAAVPLIAVRNPTPAIQVQTSRRN
jgi:sulfite reductase alpha subunit-like flavoprotein